MMRPSAASPRWTGEAAHCPSQGVILPGMPKCLLKSLLGHIHSVRAEFYGGVVDLLCQFKVEGAFLGGEQRNWLSSELDEHGN